MNFKAVISINGAQTPLELKPATHYKKGVYEAKAPKWVEAPKPESVEILYRINGQKIPLTLNDTGYRFFGEHYHAPQQYNLYACLTYRKSYINGKSVYNYTVSLDDTTQTKKSPQTSKKATERAQNA